MEHQNQHIEETFLYLCEREEGRGLRLNWKESRLMDECRNALVSDDWAAYDYHNKNRPKIFTSK